MDPQPAKHKKVKHFDIPGHVHELTFSCYQCRPLLTNDRWRAMLSESINRALEGHLYDLVAFVYMPEHVHLIVLTKHDSSGVSDFLRAVKRPFSVRVKRLLVEGKCDLLEQLTIRQRPGVTTFRLWQEGPGYDRNLTEVRSILAAIDYVHLNPVRRGLVRSAIDWRWSSARYYLQPGCCPDAELPTIRGLPAEWLA